MYSKAVQEAATKTGAATPCLPTILPEGPYYHKLIFLILPEGTDASNLTVVTHYFAFQ
jgi:hypothetical protein